MSLVNRIAELDRQAAHRGWLGEPVTITTSELRHEMATVPPGWFGLGAIGEILLLLVSLPAAVAGIAALLVGWSVWAATSISRRRLVFEREESILKERARLIEGSQVVVLAQPFYGVRGRLVRRTTLIGKPAWLVELDLGRDDRYAIKRTRVVEAALTPAENADAVATNAGLRRSASARFIFSVFVPAGAGVWFYLPRPLPILVDVLLAVAALVGWMPRRR